MTHKEKLNAIPIPLISRRSAKIRPKPLKRLKRRIRSAFSGFAPIYIPLRRLRRADTVATLETDLCLEGFPRCGNTWAEMAIRYASEKPLDMAHHSHAAAHVIYCARRGIPTLVLFREPDDAVRSLLAMGAQNMTVSDAYREYATFYEAILKIPKGKIAFASFVDVTQNMERVIAFIRDQFGLNISPFDTSDPAHKQAVFALMDQRAAKIRVDKQAISQSNPTHYDEEQEAFKHIVREEIERLASHPSRTRAQEAYQKLRSSIS